MAMLKKQLKKALILTLATVFLLLGLAGLVLPVLQGWLFLAISALLFSMYSPRIRTFIDTHTAKYPKIHTFVGRAQDWTTKVFGAPEV
jgi:uncharacterized protein